MDLDGAEWRSHSCFDAVQVMLEYLGFALGLTLAASAPVARDLLPLQRGIYVDARVLCSGASNADVLSYWGADNGVNASKVTCRITRLKKNGPTYLLWRSCKPIDGRGIFKDRKALKVLGQTSFAFGEGVTLAASAPVYRYCGAKVEF